MAKIQPATRIRTCRCCGKKYEYPLKEIAATRHHCEDCAVLPPDTRKVMERLCSRIAALESLLNPKSDPGTPV
jgi:hypothetical protein